jgi:hypothetical protein
MIQTSRLQGMDVLVNPQSCLDDKTLKALLIMKDRVIEKFKFKKN